MIDEDLDSQSNSVLDKSLDVSIDEKLKALLPDIIAKVKRDVQ